MMSPKRSAVVISFVLLAVVLVAPATGSGAIIYESATLGPTGQSGGASVNSSQFLAVRFLASSSVTTGSIGGHLQGFVSGGLFGAVVALTGSTDFPDSFDLSTADVLGAAVLPATSPSDEVAANLSVSLTAGNWYALVFGSGLFGATGSGAMPLNDTAIGTPSYFFKSTSTTWNNGGFSNARFFLDTNAVTVVPEPHSAALFAVGLVGLAGRGLRRRFARRRAK